jgi:ABC-type nickel/cobalt efflux system permease component RcnA
MLALIGHYATFLEWAMGDVLVIGFAVWQIISVRRSLRQDRARDAIAQRSEASEAAKTAPTQPADSHNSHH